MTLFMHRDERLFYKVLESNVEDIMPLVYTPIVGEACIKYGFIFTEPKLVSSYSNKIYSCLN